MPEGDTIWHTARILKGVLAGQEVAAFHSSLSEIADMARRYCLVGRQITNVESNGKHLLILVSSLLNYETNEIVPRIRDHEPHMRWP
jgi:formamidopyrimidine-DNA glycosylase